MKKTKLGQSLISGLNEAVEYERGKKRLRTKTIEMPEPARHWKKEQIARVRRDIYQVSQPVFASFLSVTPSTVKAWEQGLKTPSGAASRLLELAEMDPRLFKRLARGR